MSLTDVLVLYRIDCAFIQSNLRKSDIVKSVKKEHANEKASTL
ncbi:hypothetical protein GLIP_3326 [Aliiglaciecola lipolytica E3]|uniref:Uncharacterized protein n=1 Tax=Aliiglaciecola lipolytica E3 TaxID=1127673 RepID=K6YXH9_9ALTE|nr:hypothetical protein GLIP_3326 [Aliiglaciecola lipolytica E3]